MPLKTMVYVDAFNLYYGALKGTPYKWLDILTLVRNMLTANNDIVGIKYFTAKVNPRPNDPQQPFRQSLYLRALATINAQCVYGHYLSHVISMPLANPTAGQSPFVRVIKTEEKGSDVNIASHLLVDAFENRYDCAVLISGDSDLQTPVKMAITKFNKTVGVLNPQRGECKALKAVASFYKHIRQPVLSASQFPPVLADAHGSFHKPQGW